MTVLEPSDENHDTTEYLSVHCPHGHNVRIPATQAGRHVACPQCETLVAVPAYRPEPTAPAITALEIGAYRYRCPGCQRNLRVHPKYFGRWVQCKLCRGPFRLPEISGVHVMLRELADDLAAARQVETWQGPPIKRDHESWLLVVGTVVCGLLLAVA
jgi:ribosomal protein S27E